LLFILASYNHANSQANISYTNATNAISSLTSGNLNTLNPNFVGGVQQLGIVDATNTNLGFGQGIILATGDCLMSANSPGNSDDSSSEGFLLSGTDPDLEIISNSIVFDAAILEFDFIATSTQASIQFVFASEEYNEYVCGAVNDAFGIFLSGPGYNGPFSNNAENVANIPGTLTPVSINTINNGNVGQAGVLDNCQSSYSDWNQYTSYFVDNSALSTNPAIIEYDGFTVPITAEFALQCGETYHIKIAIGDGGDPVYDSAVFLLAEGLNTAQINLIETDSTQICYGTSTILNTAISGNATWSPAIGLDDPNSANPVANPLNDTWYTVSSNACGISMTDSIFVDVSDIIETVNFVSICEGESYTEGNSVYTNFGIYENTYPSAGGCDSLVTTYLSIIPTVETTFIANICQGETYTEGSSVYTESGTYQDYYQNSNGCDSIVTTILNVTASPITTINETICFGDSYQEGSFSYNLSGTYTNMYQAANGCDSTVILNLVVLPEIAISLTSIICEGEVFEFGNETYTESGAYSQNYSTVNGCDSTVYISLIVNPVIQTTNEVEICLGGTYTEGNSIYSDQGVYEDYYTAINGCDSIVTTILELTDYYTTTNNITICEGESYTEGTSIYSQSGTYEDLYQTNQGCDSLVTTILTTVEAADITNEINICEGQSYQVGSSIYTESGSYSNLFQSSVGCDSIVNTYLSVNDVYELSFEVNLCVGEDYTIGNNIYTESGVYENILQTAMGCDSVIITHLNFQSTSASDNNLTVCEGDSIEVEGVFYSNNSEFDLNLQSANGCDSVVHYSIEVISNETTSYSEQICPFESFELDLSDYENVNIEGSPSYNEGIYSFYEEGIYTYSVQTENCQSTGTIEIESIPFYESRSEEIRICDGDEIVLEVEYPEIPFSWNVSGQENELYVNSSGHYVVNYDYACGEFYEEYTVNSEECNCEIFIPNAFTPDADGINETWSPVPSCDLVHYELTIFDRWGQEIFSVDDIEIPFNGGAGDYYHQSGVYVYKLSYKFSSDATNRVKKGHITLVR